MMWRASAELFVREAVRALSRNKLRSVLAAIAIMIGIGAVVCVVAIGRAGASRAEEQLRNLGENFVWIEAGSRSPSGVRTGSHGTTRLTMGDAHAVGRELLIKRMTPNVDGSAHVVNGNRNWHTHWRGIDVTYFEIKQWDVSSGTHFLDNDVISARSVVLIGETVREQLFGEEDPIGQVIRINEQLFQVVGVLARKGPSAFGSDQDDTLILPWTRIGIRLAVGATEGAVQMQFLGEAVMLTLFGGVLGLFLGAAACIALGRILGWSTPVPPDAFAVAPLVSTVVGVFFGFYPARRAARLDPIAALRHE